MKRWSILSLSCSEQHKHLLANLIPFVLILSPSLNWFWNPRIQNKSFHAKNYCRNGFIPDKLSPSLNACSISYRFPTSFETKWPTTLVFSYHPVLLMRCEYATIPDIINHSVRKKCFDIIEKAVAMCIKHIYDFGEITRKGVGLVNKRESDFGLHFSK